MRDLISLTSSSQPWQSWRSWAWLQYEVTVMTCLLLSSPASPLSSLHHHQAATDFLPKTAWSLTG